MTAYVESAGAPEEWPRYAGLEVAKQPPQTYSTNLKHYKLHHNAVCFSLSSLHSACKVTSPTDEETKAQEYHVLTSNQWAICNFSQVLPISFLHPLPPHTASTFSSLLLDATLLTLVQGLLGSRHLSDLIFLGFILAGGRQVAFDMVPYPFEDFP